MLNYSRMSDRLICVSMRARMILRQVFRARRDESCELSAIRLEFYYCDRLCVYLARRGMQSRDR